VTKPRPPKGFLKGTTKGDQVDLGKMPIGGKRGVPPIQNGVLPEQKTTMSADMRKEMAQGIVSANARNGWQV